ncbi:hypothetical protein CKO28_13335 [Rhodovibrio sodomensis]|uniref:SH3b domain-containing protein n=1 Tax=Rhodovibrio sodomensis TaxID=1088 RepID=A0ABS1DEW9_9PROT|nr:SH3 domain-containing protein [Rhodovibrio sodomensis]MBK1669015.1 hypothetical protein [Rhodovibrio sodomensis]
MQRKFKYVLLAGVAVVALGVGVVSVFILPTGGTAIPAPASSSSGSGSARDGSDRGGEKLDGDRTGTSGEAPYRSPENRSREAGTPNGGVAESETSDESPETDSSGQLDEPASADEGADHADKTLREKRQEIVDAFMARLYGYSARPDGFWDGTAFEGGQLSREQAKDAAMEILPPWYDVQGVDPTRNPARETVDQQMSLVIQDGTDLLMLRKRLDDRVDELLKGDRETQTGGSELKGKPASELLSERSGDSEGDETEEGNPADEGGEGSPKSDAPSGAVSFGKTAKSDGKSDSDPQQTSGGGAVTFSDRASAGSSGEAREQPDDGSSGKSDGIQGRSADFLFADGDDAADGQDTAKDRSANTDDGPSASSGAVSFGSDGGSASDDGAKPEREEETSGSGGISFDSLSDEEPGDPREAGNSDSERPKLSDFLASSDDDEADTPSNKPGNPASEDRADDPERSGGISFGTVDSGQASSEEVQEPENDTPSENAEDTTAYPSLGSMNDLGASESDKHAEAGRGGGSGENAKSAPSKSDDPEGKVVSKPVDEVKAGAGSKADAPENSGGADASKKAFSFEVAETFDRVMWAKKRSNIRAKPTTSARSLGVLETDSGIRATGRVAGERDGYRWIRIEHNGRSGYIASFLLSGQPPEFRDAKSEEGGSGLPWKN